MSYCQTCGGFAVGCPRPGEGVCVPGPNPFEERAVRLFALAVVVNAEVAALVTANQNLMLKQLPPAFTRSHFEALAEKLTKEIEKP